MKKLSQLVLTVILLTVSACGGGTSGTGDYSGHQARVQGTLVLNSGETAAGYIVTVEATGDSAVTNANGEFAIDTVIDSPQASLLVQADSFSASAAITDIPSDAAVIEVLLQVSTSDDSVSVLSVQVFDNTVPASGISAPADRQKDSSATPEDKNDQKSSRRSIYRGNVIFEDDSPGKGVKVSIAGTDAADTADRSGNFSIETKPAGGSVKLRVSYKGDSTSIKLDGIPKRAVIVELKLRVYRKDTSSIGSSSVFDAQLLDIKTKDAN